MSIKILFIDDDEDTLYIARHYLVDDFGFEITFCRSGQEAIQFLYEQDYDLIVSDHEMPGMTGLDLLRDLRQRENEIPFIIFTGRSREDVAIAALNLGASHYVKKGGDAESQYAELAHIIQKTYSHEQDHSALLESEMKFRTLVQSMNDLVSVIDKDDCFIQYHTSSDDVVFFEPDMLLHKHVSEVLPTHVSNLLLQLIQEVRESKEVRNCEYWLPTEDGQTWFDTTLSIHEDGESTVAVMRNITERKNTEEKLLLTQFSLDNATEPIMWIAPDASFIYVTRMACLSLGYTEDELLQMTIFDIDTKCTIFDWTDIWQEAREAGSIVLESELKTKTSRVFPVEINLSFQKIGKREFGFAYITDQTEQRKAEQDKQDFELAYKDERERTRLYQNIAGVLHIALDSDGRVTLANKKACEVLECRMENIVGVNWFESFIPETARNEVRDIFEQLMIGEIEPVEFIEGSVRTTTGQKRVIKWWNTVIRNDNGEISGTFSSGEDITEQRRVNLVRRESEKQYAKLISAIPQGIGITNINEELVSCNDAFVKLLDYSRNEVIGRSIFEFIHISDIEKLYIESINNHPERRTEYEIRIAHRNGSYIDVKIQRILLKNEHNEIIGTISVISEKPKLEEDTDISKKQKDELSNLAHVMKHDLGNNLHSLRGYLRLLEKQHDQEIIKRSLKLISRMDELLSSSVTLADAGLVIDNVIDVNLEEIVDELVTTMVPDSIKFERDLLPNLKGDPRKIRQIFQNILANAVEHGKPSFIEIRFKNSLNSLDILIENDGEPIDRYQRERILTGLFKEDGRNRGFGLAIVKKLVEAHGWEISLDQTEKTVFRIIIRKH